MAKYCVIGSNSFSGQDFVDLLLDEPSREVIGISRSAEAPDHMLRYKQRADLSRFRFHRFDMNRDAEALLAFLDRERPDYIVNFAAQSEVAPSWEHPEHWFETNTVGLAKLVNHLRRQDWLKRYLHISSPEAYGSCVGTVTEETPDDPSTPYAASKAAADMLIGVYQKQYGFPAMYIRATNVYGARQQLFKIIPRTAIFLKRGRRIQLH
ncbi:MAG TPA: GDP-mannose 4,6-dehydratase, partial [Solirubrobacterales bacterium]|nr:GDP-mannose 4,6-dehydratase [Solirubrobacterales bacterium]